MFWLRARITAQGLRAEQSTFSSAENLPQSSWVDRGFLTPTCRFLCLISDFISEEPGERDLTMAQSAAGGDA